MKFAYRLHLHYANSEAIDRVSDGDMERASTRIKSRLNALFKSVTADASAGSALLEFAVKVSKESSSTDSFDFKYSHQGFIGNTLVLLLLFEMNVLLVYNCW